MSEKFERAMGEAAINSSEKDNCGPEMTRGELATHFKEPIPTEATVKTPTTEEEMVAFEEAQKYSEDIYAIAGRVKNAATLSANSNLTPVGEMLANSFTHVLKALYDFSNTLKDSEEKKALKELIRKQEGMPASFIAATKNR